jgi:hypothetical protein
VSDGRGRSGNRSRAIGFRDAALAVLHERGVLAARRRPLDGLDAGQALFHDDASIDGLPWVLTAHRQKTMNLSLMLDAAQARAEEAGCELFANLHSRRGHSTEDAYVVMTLRTFATVLRRLHPEVATPTTRSAA